MKRIEHAARRNWRPGEGVEEGGTDEDNDTRKTNVKYEDFENENHYMTENK